MQTVDTLGHIRFIGDHLRRRLLESEIEPTFRAVRIRESDIRNDPRQARSDNHPPISSFLRHAHGKPELTAQAARHIDDLKHLEHRA